MLLLLLLYWLARKAAKVPAWNARERATERFHIFEAASFKHCENRKMTHGKKPELLRPCDGRWQTFAENGPDARVKSGA
jgi:hypothetical protein